MASDVGVIGEVHRDARRTISEWNGDTCSVQAFVVHADDLPLGRHFHEEKTETFVIRKGGGVVLLCGVDADGNRVGEVRSHTLVNGSVVVIEPRTAHTFYLKPGTEMLCHSSAPFNPEAPDMRATNWLVRE